jgi:hypothetical protein
MRAVRGGDVRGMKSCGKANRVEGRGSISGLLYCTEGGWVRCGARLRSTFLMVRIAQRLIR